MMTLEEFMNNLSPLIEEERISITEAINLIIDRTTPEMYPEFLIHWHPIAKQHLYQWLVNWPVSDDDWNERWVLGVLDHRAETNEEFEDIEGQLSQRNVSARSNIRLIVEKLRKLDLSDYA